VGDPKQTNTEARKTFVRTRPLSLAEKKLAENKSLSNV
jgi:hypothetical protein